MATKKTSKKSNASKKTAKTAPRAAKVETRAPTQQVRQGDVFLRRTEKVSGEIVSVTRDPRGIVIAEGLDGSERVVTTAGAFLHEGEEVRLADPDAKASP